MSNFTPLVPFAIDFDGDHVTMNLRRLKKKAFMAVAPHFTGEMEDGVLQMTFKDQEQLLILMDTVLPEHVMNFEGLKTVDGITVSLKEAIDESYFLKLTSSILGELFKSSNPTIGEEDNPKDHGEAGNSNGQAPETAVD